MKFQQLLQALFILQINYTNQIKLSIKNRANEDAPTEAGTNPQNMTHFKQIPITTQQVQKIQQRPSAFQATEDGYINIKDFEEVFKEHRLTQTEIRLIQNIADLNHDGLLSEEEWKAFHKQYVSPFQSQCDMNNDQIISKTELIKCLTISPWLRKMNIFGYELSLNGYGPFENKTTENAYDLADDLIYAVDRDLDGQINFLEYLYIRRGAIAWSHCASDGMTRPMLRCAMAITSPKRLLDPSEATILWRIALSLMDQKQQTHVSFPVFLMIADIYDQFLQFEGPIVSGTVTRKEAVRAVRDNLLPSRLSVQSVNWMYDAMGEEVSFYEQALGQIWISRYALQTQKTQGSMYIDQFLGFLHDKFIPRDLRRVIDLFPVDLPTDQMVAAAWKVNRNTMSSDYKIEKNFETEDIKEEDFFVSFLQKSALKGEPAHVEQIFQLEDVERQYVQKMHPHENKQRGVIFNIANVGGNGMSFTDWFRLLKIQQMQYHFAGGVSSGMLDYIYADQIKSGINTLTDSSGYMFQPNKQEIEVLTDMTAIMDWRPTNFKQFLILMVYHDVFKRWTIRREGLLNSGLNYEYIEAGLKQCSLPVIKGFFRKQTKGLSLDGIKLFDHDMILRTTVVTEMEVCYNIYQLNVSNKLETNLNNLEMIDGKLADAPLPWVEVAKKEEKKF